uniref:MHC class I-like antigen recognition-like domain-containing protein n=1 Tax=Theropithecus gelada TaxID=9565 RepID=A0A8D2EG73_THEGE
SDRAGRFLFLFRTQLWLSSSPGPHSLHYNLTVLSRDGSVQPGFLAEGHLDGQPFLLFNRQRAVLGAETWDTETEDLTENGQDLRRALAYIKGQKGGESRQRKCMKVLFGTAFNGEERDSVTDHCWVSASCNFRTTVNTKRIKNSSTQKRGFSFTFKNVLCSHLFYRFLLEIYIVW